MKIRSNRLLLPLFLLTACAAGPLDETDALDAGSHDAAATELTDAGDESEDAGTEPDAGAPDAGVACGITLAGSYAGAESTNGGATQKTNEARAWVSNLAQAMARMRTDTGNGSAASLANLDALMSTTSPCPCGELKACGVAFPGAACWGGPYLTLIRRDPWGLAYRLSVDQGAVEARSAGPDGVFETSDDVFTARCLAGRALRGCFGASVALLPCP